MVMDVKGTRPSLIFVLYRSVLELEIKDMERLYER